MHRLPAARAWPASLRSALAEVGVDLGLDATQLGLERRHHRPYCGRIFRLAGRLDLLAQIAEPQRADRALRRLQIVADRAGLRRVAGPASGAELLAQRPAVCR
jgi:hypothetical protein